MHFSIRGGTFLCANCGQTLRYSRENIWFVLPPSLVLSIFLAFVLGYRGYLLALVALCAIPVTFFVGISIAFHVHPPGAEASTKDGNAALRLFDKFP